MRNIAMNLAAIVLVGCVEHPSGDLERTTAMPAHAESARALTVAEPPSAAARYNPNVIGLDIPATRDLREQAFPSSQPSSPSAKPNVPGKSSRSTAARANRARSDSSRSTTRPSIEQVIAAVVSASEAAASLTRVESGASSVGVSSVGVTEDLAKSDTTLSKPLPAAALFEPGYPKPSFVKPDELSLKTPPPAEANSPSTTVYPTRGQAALSTGSPTLYPPTDRFNTEPGNPSLYPSGPLAPRGFRGP